MPVLDHEQTGIAPGYRIAEVTDGWIAVAATTDDELAALCTVAGVAAADDAAEALATRTNADALAALACRGRAVRRWCDSTSASRSSRPPTTTPPG